MERVEKILVKLLSISISNMETQVILVLATMTSSSHSVQLLSAFHLAIKLILITILQKQKEEMFLEPVLTMMFLL